MWMLNVLVFFIVAAVLSICAQEEVIVETPKGSIKGLKLTTHFNGKPYYSFRGIPYVKPQIGSHKFNVATPPEPWTGPLDATAHKPHCVFFCMIRQGLFGDEDCLYLNVFTPAIENDANKPVIVFFHPGGFNAGSGDDDVLGPDFLIEQDVILVTLNFRLGAVGFISTGDKNAPGNVGLKDQVMALKWIKDNIANFGGNPEKVTLSGMSSGSASVQFHLSSPMSKGLFSGAIMQSGSIINPWAVAYDCEDMAFKLGEALGIKTADSAQLMDKLKELSVQELVTASQEIAKTINQVSGRPFAFLPCVEPNVGQEIFLTNDPWTLLKSDDFVDVPVLLGLNNDETSFMAPMYAANAEMLDQHFELFIPEDVNATDAMKEKYGQMLREFYFDGKPLTKDSLAQTTMMTSDVMFNAGVLIYSKIISARIKSPIYKYLFSYYSPYGFMKNLFKHEAGVNHGDEMGYLYYSNAFKNKPESGSVQEKMVRVLTKLWANFAKEGNPTPSLDEDITTMWEPMGPEDNYLEIKKDLRMDKSLFKERLKLWAEIYNEAVADYAFLFK